MMTMRKAAFNAGRQSGKNNTNNNKALRSPAVPTRSKYTPIMPKLHMSRRVQHALTGLALLLVSYIIPAYPDGFVLLALATAAFYYVHAKRVHDEEWDEWYLEQFGALLREHERGEWENRNAARDAGSIPDENNDHREENGSTRRYKRRRRKTHPALPGAFYFLLGTTLSTLLFPTVVARTSLLVLSVADPIAGVAGVWFSNRGYNATWKRFFGRICGRDNAGEAMDGGPSVAGSSACAICTVVCTYIYIPSRSVAPTAASGACLTFGSRLGIGMLTAVAEAVAGRSMPVVGNIADDNLLIPLVVGGLICWLDERR